MNICVCVKQTPDTAAHIRLNAAADGIDETGITWVMSPFDEYAVEEALRLKDKFAGSTVVVLSAGPSRVTEVIRSALALGADAGIQIELPETADNNMTARALAAALGNEANPDIILTGKEAIDDGSGQVSQLIAEFMNLPCVVGVVGVEACTNHVTCKRVIEGGALEIVEALLPAVVAAEKGLNDPRYAKLPDIMRARKKEIRRLKASELGVSEADIKIRYANFQLPPPRKIGRKIEGAAAVQARELVRLLHEDAEVV